MACVRLEARGCRKPRPRRSRDAYHLGMTITSLDAALIEDCTHLSQAIVAERAFAAELDRQLRDHGLTYMQYLMLLLAAARTADPPRITDLADTLSLRHHSTVELVNRSVAIGIIERQTDKVDCRVQRILVTAHGMNKLRELAPDVLTLHRMWATFHSLHNEDLSVARLLASLKRQQSAGLTEKRAAPSPATR